MTVWRLAGLQLVTGAEYSEKSNASFCARIPSKLRGEIFDRYGRPLVTNRQVFSLRFDYVYWDRSRQNEVILGVLTILDECGDRHSDSLPVSNDAPFEYTFPKGTETSESRKLYQFLSSNAKKLPQSPTAQELIDALSDFYSLPEGLSPAERRALIGVRYEMDQRSFSSYNNTFTVATDSFRSRRCRDLRRNHLNFPERDYRGFSREYRTDFAAKHHRPCRPDL